MRKRPFLGLLFVKDRRASHYDILCKQHGAGWQRRSQAPCGSDGHTAAQQQVVKHSAVAADPRASRRRSGGL